MRFKGKVAIVTGARTGIGKAAAIRFAKEGAVVACLGHNGAEQTVQEITGAGGQAKNYKMSVAYDAEWKAVVKDLTAEFGKIDILVNNAGVTSKTDFVVKQTEEEWDRIVNTNLKGNWLGMRNVIPVMIENGGGKIVNIASIVAFAGMPGHAIYGATKGGIISLSQQAALEHAKDNIQVNVVAPGITKTELFARFPIDENRINEICNLIPAGRMGKPEELASMIVFLASEEANFITSHVHIVDGGILSHL